MQSDHEGICAPGKLDKENDTCFSMDDVLHIAKCLNDYLNKERKSGTIYENMEPIQVTGNKKQMIRQILDRFKNVCGSDQKCITRQDFMLKIINNNTSLGEKMRKELFLPELPSNPNQWLSTTDINNIMKQYEAYYKDFYFTGAVPLDCTKLSFCQLSNINYSKLESEGKTRIGTVFNLDKYGMPGSHWTALIIDMGENAAYYADSNGDKIPKLVMEHIDKYRSYCTGCGKGYPKIKENTKKYQYDKSECGIYSCHFIVQLLKGRTFEEYINNAPRYEEINMYRNHFSSNKPIKNNKINKNKNNNN